MNTAAPRSARGFTLIELAIALVVIGLLLGLLAPSLALRMEQRQLAETRQALAEAQEALLGFAVANGRLPRPATSFASGEERETACGNDVACTGFLPWQTLGTKKTDGWGRLIRYSVTPAHADTVFTLASAGKKKIRTRNAAGELAYLVGNDSSCSAANPCAVAVIHSTGKNNWGTLADGTAVGDGSDTNTDEDANESASTRFIARPPGEVPEGGEFDDIVTWLPATVLNGRMVAAGRLP